jgi:sulfur carrier protein ThiS
MQVEIRIATILRNKISSSDKNLVKDKWDLPEDTKVAEILRMLNLTNSFTILVVNDRQVNKETILGDGDVLKVFSAVSGG